jgi:transcriptional regulator with XRE-family HTH domain
MPRSSFSEAYRKSIAILTETRKATNVTQTALAEKLCKPQSFVAKFEGFERRLDVVEYLAVGDALGVSRQDLLSRLIDQLPQRLEI